MNVPGEVALEVCVFGVFDGSRWVGLVKGDRADEQQSELAAIQDKLAKTRAAMDRYFRAFEAGTMPEDTCAPRIASLGEQIKALEGRAADLAAVDDDEQPERANTAELDALRNTLQAALMDSTPARTKAVFQTMIDGIRVDARDHIQPTFRVPAVRIDYGYMGETWRRANRTLMAAPAIGLA